MGYLEVNRVLWKLVYFAILKVGFCSLFQSQSVLKTPMKRSCLPYQKLCDFMQDPFLYFWLWKVICQMPSFRFHGKALLLEDLTTFSIKLAHCLLQCGWTSSTLNAWQLSKQIPSLLIVVFLCSGSFFFNNIFVTERKRKKK